MAESSENSTPLLGMTFCAGGWLEGSECRESASSNQRRRHLRKELMGGSGIGARTPAAPRLINDEKKKDPRNKTTEARRRWPAASSCRNWCQEWISESRLQADGSDARQAIKTFDAIACGTDQGSASPRAPHANVKGSTASTHQPPGTCRLPNWAKCLSRCDKTSRLKPPKQIKDVGMKCKNKGKVRDKNKNK